ncbi:MAG: hypothetical protein IKT40_12415 [Bacilli bacterium]|nr:hypothetical protein [Bacilli bacterium]
MSREEQIKHASVHVISNEAHDLTWVDGFESGARWADNNPKEGLISIDKATKWLQENTNPIFYSGNGWTTNEFIEHFINAMKD